jgi:hypothetical protein
MAIDWISNVTQTNQTLNSSLYGNLGQGEGIDLRIEMNRLLYGYVNTLPKGHWVILRQFDRSKESEYFNKRTKEGVGGPAYEYKDILLRTRRVPIMTKRDTTSDIKPGVLEEDTFMYYFEYFIFPKIGDDIFELDIADHRYQPTSYNFIKRYRIKKVLPYRLETGNIQYHSTVTVQDQINY